MLFCMNEIEKRRLELLEETRNTYNLTYHPPAVHPRYQSALLTNDRKREGDFTTKHFWILRSVIAVLILSLFALMYIRKEEIGTIDSQRIIQEVQRDLLSK